MPATQHECTAECQYPPTFLMFNRAFSHIAEVFGYAVSGGVETDDGEDYSMLIEGSFYSVSYNASDDTLDLEYFDDDKEEVEVLATFGSDETAICAGDFIGLLVTEQIDKLAEIMEEINARG